MEEDLKVLEEFRKTIKNFNNYADNTNVSLITKKQVKAIENLIKRNKELEEENIKYERANDYLQALNRKYYEDNVTLLRKNGKVDILADSIHFKYIDIADNYIPKSKVRELQDKYKNKIEKLESKKIWNEPVDTINKNRYTNYFNAYEELLVEGDK